MKNRILITASALATAGLIAFGAHAESNSSATPPANALSVAQIATMLTEQGYQVREIEFEHGRYEAEMIDANGMKVEAYLDATTGNVLPYGSDDDDNDDDNGRDDD